MCRGGGNTSGVGMGRDGWTRKLNREETGGVGDIAAHSWKWKMTKAREDALSCAGKGLRCGRLQHYQNGGKGGGEGKTGAPEERGWSGAWVRSQAAQDQVVNGARMQVRRFEKDACRVR